MELRDYFRVIRSGWPLVATFVLLGVALSAWLTLATPNEYQASVEIFVATSSSSDPSQLQAGNVFTQDRVQSYTRIATGPSVTGAVVDRLKLNMTSQELSNEITADAPSNTVIIDLHVTDHIPGRAATLADAVAAEFDKVVQKIEQPGADGNPVVKLTVIHPATVPGSPVKPRPINNIGLGLGIGLFLGVATVLVRDVLDNTVRRPQDIEEFGLTVLGDVPFDKNTSKLPNAFRDDPHGSRADAYRQIRTNMQFADVNGPPRIIAVTSAVPGEGRSTTAINLAAALAEGGNRVCLIEADLRHPSLAKSFGIASGVGLTSVLTHDASVESALQDVDSNFVVLTSGPVPPNPSELLITDHARKVIADIAAMVDFTVIDTAPLLRVTDGVEVAALADATLVVHHAGKTTREQAALSVGALNKVGKRAVGVVLNMGQRSRGVPRNYHYLRRHLTSVASPLQGDPRPSAAGRGDT